jgi:chemotaxis signal transduction protein
MNTSAETIEYVTATVGGQLFGLPISRVQDVFVPERLTRVPLAPPEIAGMLNLRGRIVTAIDLRKRLSLDAEASERPRMAVGIEYLGESYGLLIDASARCSSFRPRAVKTIRSTSMRGSRAWRPACTGSRESSWSCSMSIACWKSARGPRLHERYVMVWLLGQVVCGSPAESEVQDEDLSGR